MTNEEAIENLKLEEIPRIGKDGFENDNLINAHIIAINALEENTKLKAEIEQLKDDSKIVAKELVTQIREIERLKSELKRYKKLMPKMCENCEHEDLLGYEEPCEACTHYSNWKLKCEVFDD